MFTDRFIKLPVQVYDRKLAEITGNTSNSEESYLKINPFDIVKYRPTWDNDDADNNEIVSMTDKNGDVTLIYLTVNEFEKLLNNAVQK